MSSIRVRCGEESRTVTAHGGETLLAALRREGFVLSAPCGGRGRCGKCRVAVNGVPRLACRVIPADGDEVTLPAGAAGHILTRTETAWQPYPPGQTGCAAAVDIGTTTVAVELYDLADGRALATRAAWNAQAAYGGDVISRIRYTVEDPDGLAELSRRIRSQTEELIRSCLSAAGRNLEELRTVSLAGNTVMQHIFAGCAVGSIAVAPYTPLTLFRTAGEDRLLGAPVRYAPCVAGYVGGDITAGLLSAGLYDRDGAWLFLDIGTNGEMALGGRDGFSCCAVASGPAFEGANISCGMPAVNGAVCRVRMDGGFTWEVIGGGEPTGLCGSGLVDLAAALLRAGILDETGRLLPPEEVPAPVRRYVEPDGRGNGIFCLTERVRLTPEDIRNLQLAKAAVAAGIELLLQKRGMAASQLQGIVMAGGFGSYIDPVCAMAIGLLPDCPAEKLHCPGNTALAGAAMAALDGRNREKLLDIADKCRYIELSGSPEFARAFTDHLTF